MAWHGMDGCDDEWNENETSSHDLTFIGALPLVLGQEVESYCKVALSKSGGNIP